jgi:hypothetical protein
LSAPQSESLPEKNLRLFNADVRPKLEAAIQKLRLDEGGTAELAGVRTFDTRIECSIVVRHGHTYKFETHFVVVFDTLDRGFRLKYDLLGNGRWQPLWPTAPVYWDNPLTGKRVVLRLQGLEEIERAFQPTTWDDPRAQPETAARLEALRSAARDYEGTWYDEGDGAKPLRITFDPASPAPLDVRYIDGNRHQVSRTELGIGPDGRLRWGTAQYPEAVLSPDGRRIEFPANGKFWTRVPTRP